MAEAKVYKNKNLGEFKSIPLKLIDESKAVDSLYLALNFKKLYTKPVADVRKSKHYASTLSAWEKKLEEVDMSDLNIVAQKLGYDVEIFNPLSANARTLFSGGARSKRTAQLLKVKASVYKPMIAGAVTRRQAEIANESPADRFKRVLMDEHDPKIGREQVREVVFDDRIQVESWNDIFLFFDTWNDISALPADTLIMRKGKIDLDADGKIPDTTLTDIRKCALASAFEDVTINGVTYKDFPMCPVGMEGVGYTQDESAPWAGEYYYYVHPKTNPPQRQCYMISSIDGWRAGKGLFEDPSTKMKVVMLEWLIYNASWYAYDDPQRPIYLNRTYFQDELEGFKGFDTRPDDYIGYDYEDNIGVGDYADDSDSDSDEIMMLNDEADEIMLNDELIQNIHDPEKVSDLIYRGANPNYDNRSPGAMTPPLHLAILRGYEETVRRLVSEGADVNKRDGDDNTPLHLIVQVIGGEYSDRYFRYIPILKLLIESGADINLKDRFNRTPLENAISHERHHGYRHHGYIIQTIKILEDAASDPERTRNDYIDSDTNGRNVRRRLSFGGGNMMIDDQLARTIELLFGQMSDLNMKSATLKKMKKDLRLSNDIDINQI